MKENVFIEGTAAGTAPAALRRVSWGAIFAGVFVTIVCQLTLTLLGVAIGASTINPLQEQQPVGQGLAIGSGIWLLVTALISVFAGAFVAGRLSGGPLRADGMLHGIVTWSVGQVAMVLLLTTAAGAMLGGVGSLLSKAMASNQGKEQGQGMLTAAQEQIKQAMPQAGALLPSTGAEGTQTPGQLTALAQQDPELGVAMGKMATKGGASKSPQDREQVIKELTAKHNMDQQQASTLVDQWDRSFQQAKGQTEQAARQAGDTVARGVSTAGWFGFIAMLLGLGASAWGGWVGTLSLARYREQRMESVEPLRRAA